MSSIMALLNTILTKEDREKLIRDPFEARQDVKEGRVRRLEEIIKKLEKKTRRR